MPAARDDFEDLKVEIANAGGSVYYGSTEFVGVTTAIDSYPTVAGAFYGVTRGALSGDEAEGGAVVFTESGDDPILAYNVGSKIPPEGTKVIVSGVPDRWAFQYG